MDLASRNRITYTVDYLDGYQYESGKLLFFPTAEGYVKYTVGVQNPFDYVFNYTDHLGNIRLSYGINPAIGLLKKMEENNYYPFGLKHGSYNIEEIIIAPRPVGGPVAGKMGKFMLQKEETLAELFELPSTEFNPPQEPTLVPNFYSGYNYKFENKEWQDELSLNLYDFGGRLYDPASVRTTTHDPLAEKFYNLSPQSFLNNNPLRFTDPTGMESDDWINYTGKNGQQQIIYDSSVKTKEQAEAAGYTNVKQVFEAGTGTSEKTGEVVNFQKEGKFSVNGGNTMDTADGGYTTQGGSYIGRNSNTLEQLAPVLTNTGDAAIVAGAFMALIGIGAPIGAGLITYGSYASTTGNVMDLANDGNNGNLTTEKVVTKVAMAAIPEVGNAAFKSLGAPAAGAVINAATVGADRTLDKLREAKVGPYKAN